MTVGNPMTTYDHTQVGRFIIATLLLVLAGAAAAFVLIHSAAMLLVFAPAMAFVGLMLGSLRVRVNAEALSFAFGVGLVRRRIPLDDIVSCVETKVRLHEGIGIHLGFRGWVYNVSGLTAVLITRKKGLPIVLGTDEPAALARAVNAAMEQMRGLRPAR